MYIEPLESRIAPAGLVVTTLKDSGAGSLRAAISQADMDGGGDVITFATGLHGTISLKSTLPTITESLSITGPGPSIIKIDGGHRHQLMNFNSDEYEPARDITISGLTLENGESGGAGGAMYIYLGPFGNVTLQNCVITGNQAHAGTTKKTSYYHSGYTGAGGAIALSIGTLNLNQCEISGNSAVGGTGYIGWTGGGARGGAVYIGVHASATISNCTFTKNIAIGGTGRRGHGGLHSDIDSGNPGEPGGNGGGAEGGAIFNSGTMTIQNSVLSGNAAIGGNAGNGGRGSAGAGGDYVFQPGSGGEGGYGGSGGNAIGGGIRDYYALDTITNSTISGNVALAGKGARGGDGGVGGPADFFYHAGSPGSPGTGGNGGSVSGAGISMFNGWLTITGSTVSGNTGAASVPGLGGRAGPHGARGTTGTAGVSYGGGIDISDSFLTMRQSTISGNTAGLGGGIHFLYNTEEYIDNSTIAMNTALQGGGGIWQKINSFYATPTLVSTVVAQNAAPAGSAQDINGPAVANHSLIGNTTGANITGTAFIVNENPMLEALANNGGTTQTMLFAAGSPLIDAGSNPDNQAFDQRGDPYSRTLGAGVDIGAVELD